jgi:hypothetical protein
MVWARLRRGQTAGRIRTGMARGDGAAAGLGCAAAAAAFNLSCGAAAAGRRRLSRCRRPGGLAALARSGQAVVGGAGDELRGRGAGGGGRRMCGGRSAIARREAAPPAGAGQAGMPPAAMPPARRPLRRTSLRVWISAFWSSRMDWRAKERLGESQTNPKNIEVQINIRGRGGRKEGWRAAQHAETTPSPGGSSHLGSATPPPTLMTSLMPSTPTIARSSTTGRLRTSWRTMSCIARSTVSWGVSTWSCVGGGG